MESNNRIENISLDEYIKNNPALGKSFKRNPPGKSQYTRTPQRNRVPSQQWRLGRNGPLKRLSRSGPLRPFFHQERAPNDGLPGLVVKRYRNLHPSSVFHRLGWNPMFTLARRRVQLARQHLWRRQGQFNPQARVLSFPMGRRGIFLPRRKWQQPFFRQPFFRQPFFRQPLLGQPLSRQPWRQQTWSRPAPPKFERNEHQPTWTRPAQQNFVERDDNARNDFLIKNERLRIQEMKLRNIQNAYQEQPQQTQYNLHQPPLLPGENTGYRIPRDEFPANVNVRPPSPEGSIISGLDRRGGNPFPNKNPFAYNPFSAAPSTSAAYIAAPNYRAGPSEAFRPTPHTTRIHLNQRFPTVSGPTRME